VHFFQSGNLYTRPDAADFGAWRPYAIRGAANQARLPQTFRSGWRAASPASRMSRTIWNFQVRDAARNSTAAPRCRGDRAAHLHVEDPKLDLGDPPILRMTA